MRFPDYIQQSETLLDYAYDIEYLAKHAWDGTARRILWRHFEQNANWISFSFGGYYDGEDKAGKEIDEKIGFVNEYVDQEELWQGILGFSIFESMERWPDEPGTYGWCLTKKVFSDFWDVGAALFPNESWGRKRCEVTEPEYPFYDETHEPDKEELTKWAIDLMLNNSMASSFEAYRAGVPLEDIAR